MRHIVGELASRAVWRYLIIHEGQVSTPKKRAKYLYIFYVYKKNIEQPDSYVSYKD